MLTIQEIIKSNLNYEKYYKNKNFCIDNSKIDGKNANEWILKKIIIIKNLVLIMEK